MRKYINAISRKSIIRTSPGQRFIGRMAAIESRSDEIEDDLLRDAFWTYYLHDVKFVKKVPRTRAVNAKILKWAMRAEKFWQSKAKTTGRMLASIRSAELLVHLLLEDPEVKKALEAQKKLEQAKAKRNAENEVDLAEAELEQALEEFGEYADSMEGNASRGQALKEAYDQSEKEDELFRGWGFEPGKLQGLDIQKIRELLSQLDSGFLNELVSEMGRIYGIATEGRETKTKEHYIITDAGYTREVLSVFPTERMFLIDETVSPELHLKVMAEYGNHGLLGMLEKTYPQNKGGFVMTIDTSGSMLGHPILMAKALALGLARAAMENDQRYYATLFSSSGQITKPITNEAGPEEILNFSKFMFNGGTDFDYALNHSLDLISKLQEPDNYDVIMITDMQAGFRQVTIDRMFAFRKLHGTRLMVLGIGTSSKFLGAHVDFVGNIANRNDLARVAKELALAMRAERTDK